MIRTSLFLMFASPLLGCGGNFPQVLWDECAGVICGPCAPALTLTVQDSTTGNPVDGLSVSLAGARCALGGCTVDMVALGTHQFTVSAPGYVSAELQQTWVDDGGKCCSCGYMSVQRTVLLTPV